MYQTDHNVNEEPGRNYGGPDSPCSIDPAERATGSRRSSSSRQEGLPPIHGILYYYLSQSLVSLHNQHLFVALITSIPRDNPTSQHTSVARALDSARYFSTCQRCIQSSVVLAKCVLRERCCCSVAVAKSKGELATLGSLELSASTLSSAKRWQPWRIEQRKAQGSAQFLACLLHTL